MPKRGANGTTVANAGPLSARCPEIGARRSRPVSLRIARCAKPTAKPKPPPTRALKTATARSQRPSRTAVGERGQLRGAAGEVAVAQHEDRRVGLERAAERRVRAASVAAPPLPITRSLRTTCAPEAAATCDVPSVEPSSATITGAPGNADASAASVSPRRSASSCAVTMMIVSAAIAAASLADARASASVARGGET